MAQSRARRRPTSSPAGAKGSKDAEKQMLYSSVTFVDLPGAVKQPSDNAVKKKGKDPLLLSTEGPCPKLHLLCSGTCELADDRCDRRMRVPRVGLPPTRTEDVSITKMQASLSNCIDMLAQRQQQQVLLWGRVPPPPNLRGGYGYDGSFNGGIFPNKNWKLCATATTDTS